MEILTRHNIDNVLWTIGTYFFFLGLNKFILFAIPRPKSYLDVTDEKQKAYRVLRWKNILVSFVHSCITSVFILYFVATKPQLYENMIYFQDEGVYNLNRFVFSYFLYDTIDNLLNDKTRKTFEIMIHHFVIIFCFGIVLFIKLYLGNLSAVILLEVHSVFLHLRHVMQHYGLKKNNFFYRLNAVLNVIALIIFRLCVMGYMKYWLYMNYPIMHTSIIVISGTGLVIFTIMNVTLLARLVISYFFRGSKKESKHAE